MAVGWTADARAQSAAIEFDIPSQPIATALVAFARQAGVRLVMSEEPSGGVAANAVRGALDRERALALLLEGTGYEGRFEDGAIRLWRVSAEGSATRQRGAENEYNDGLVQLAQGDTGQASASNRPVPSERHVRDAEEEKDEEIVVVGTNIRGIYPASSPVEIYTAEDIARTGAITTEQFIERLPQNLGTRTQYAPGTRRDSSNREGVSSIDLRGLGVGTTLVLLNGRRMALASDGQAVDTSLLPLSAIERVEVLTDGASAVYGSDAIGGVVNFVLRNDFEGAETGIRYGTVASGSLRQGGGSQALGWQWEAGRAFVALDYFAASALDRENRSYATEAGPGGLTPHEVRGGLFATISHDLTQRMTLSGDAMISLRDTKTDYAGIQYAQNGQYDTNHSETEQYFANLGIDYAIAESWRVSFLTTYTQYATQILNHSEFPRRLPPLTTDVRLDTDYSAMDLTAKLEGELFSLPGGRVRFSLGGGYTEETLDRAATGRNLGRRVSYAFGEVYLPVIGESDHVPLVRRLDLNLAARYTSVDDASEPRSNQDFGAETSPKLGLVWSPMESLNIRGTYGESFRAASLTQLDNTNAVGSLRTLLVGGQLRPLLAPAGPAPELRPEEAATYTFGFDFRPGNARNWHLSTTYFNIDYSDRIGLGDPTNGAAALANPASYPDVVYAPPSAQYIENILRTVRITSNTLGVDLSDLEAAALELYSMPNFVIADIRTRNLAISTMDGLDVAVGYDQQISWAHVSAGLSLTRIFDYVQQTTVSAPVVTVVDTATLPADLRGRGYVGVTLGAFQSTVSVNYVDDYSNPFALGGPQDVKSWTTIDWILAYNFGQHSERILGDVRLSLSVQNLFDNEPPFVRYGGPSGQVLRAPIGFDPANANPLGQFVAFQVAKQW